MRLDEFDSIQLPEDIKLIEFARMLDEQLQRIPPNGQYNHRIAGVRQGLMGITDYFKYDDQIGSTMTILQYRSFNPEMSKLFEQNLKRGRLLIELVREQARLTLI